MPEVVIVSGVRSPFVKAAGPLARTPAQDLGRYVVRELLERTNLDPAEVDELIAGNVASPVDAANVARVIALRAGIPKDRVAHTVNRNCASGIECVTEAYDRIQSGRAQCVVALGVDSMSNIPVLWSTALADKFYKLSIAKTALAKLTAASKIRLRDLKPRIGVQLGLTDPVSGMMMGDTADKLAREYGITREEQDLFALRSHERALAAWAAGRFDREVMPLYPEPDSQAITKDIGPREGQTYAALAKMKPYFDRRWGTVTVGNACQITDGAAALLLMEAGKAKSLGYEPWGRIKSYAYAGCDPSRMGIGPVYSTAKALDAAGMQLNEIDLIELNEAFAAQALACVRGFDSPPLDCSALRLGAIDEDRLNVNGGAIALGHPVGATGARLILTLFHELTRRHQSLGLATLCIGGGQGAAVIVERTGHAE